MGEITPEIQAMIDEYVRLMAVWAMAGSAAGRTAAWDAVVSWLVRNPAVYQAIGARYTINETVVAAVEQALLRAFAAKGVERGIQATARPSLRLFLVRLGMANARGPKIPIPQAQLVLTIAITLSMVGSAFAEGKKMGEKVPAYQDYLVKYLKFTAQAVGYHPWVATHLAEPMPFDAWYAEQQAAEDAEASQRRVDLDDGRPPSFVRRY